MSNKLGSETGSDRRDSSTSLRPESGCETNLVIDKDCCTERHRYQPPHPPDTHHSITTVVTTSARADKPLQRALIVTQYQSRTGIVFSHAQAHIPLGPVSP